jgi:hypothetical protein
MRIREAQKHTDPDADPDPEHCEKVINCCGSESVTSRPGRTGSEMTREVGSGHNHQTMKKGHLRKRVIGSLDRIIVFLKTEVPVLRT